MAATTLIKGGKLFRSTLRDFETGDILIEGPRIRATGRDLAAPDDAVVIDAAGALVTPGLIDFHMHAFRYGHFLSIDADEVAHRSGTTTFVSRMASGSEIGQMVGFHIENTPNWLSWSGSAQAWIIHPRVGE